MEIILALGSNLGNRMNFIETAIFLLKKTVFIKHDIQTSSVYESKALLKNNSPSTWDNNYLNMAIKGETNLLPHELLKKIKSIELSLGRSNQFMWSPREIDIDILSYNNAIIKESGLVIPHKHLLDRDFFMLPLKEMDSKWLYKRRDEYFNKTIDDIIILRKDKLNKTIISRKKYA